ncbi:hypothetical protein BH09DEP1_BH09DEP1_2700 [soil metagenome]
MKSFLKVLGLAALFSGSLLQGYAIVFDKNSVIPYVDIYVYKVNSAEEAIKKHGNYARLLGLPQTVIDVLEKGRGISATIATAAGPATEGASVFIQKGFYGVVDAGKTGIKLFNNPLNDLLGRAFRGDDHAFHEDVWRGNRGRNAEWATNNPSMYAIVTLPNNLVALGDPVLLPMRGVTGFTVTTSPDPEKPGNTLYKSQFGSQYASQYIRSEDDKRDKNKAKALAKESGERAFNGQ